MANNRMYLKCKECGESAAIAKFYPAPGFISGDNESGWYTNERFMNQMNTLFEKHHHNKDSSNFGGYQYELVYEVAPSI